MKHNARKFIALVCALATVISATSVLSINAAEAPESLELIDRSYGLRIEDEQEYFDQFIAPRIASGELAPYRPSAANARTVTNLPDSCDNSTSPYFPAIGDQGQVGSCVAFATTYYHFTYEANKLRNITTTPGNTCSPQWTYSHTNHGIDAGSTIADAYFFLGSVGSIRYEDYEEDEILTDNDFVTHWSTNTAAAVKALGIKCTDEEIIFGGYDLENIGVRIAVTFDTGTESDYYLDGIKAGLADGEIYTFGCNYYCDEMSASSEGTHEGEKVVVRSSYAVDAEGNLYNHGHALTMVGYDDNVCVDVNGDGVIEAAERGAFKIANSWGADWGNDGYIWILYDALNESTQHSDPSWEENFDSPYRKAFIDRNLVTKIDAYENTNEIYAIVDYETDYKFNVDVYTYRTVEGTQVTEELDYLEPHRHYYNERLNYAPFDGQIVMDFAQSTDTIEDYYTGSTWTVGTFFNDELNHNTLNSTVMHGITYIDRNMNTVATHTGVHDEYEYFLVVNDIIAGSAYYYYNTDINLTLGDINYDNVIDSNDATILRAEIAGNADISAVQEFLCDINGDGNINSIDAFLLNRLMTN